MAFRQIVRQQHPLTAETFNSFINIRRHVHNEPLTIFVFMPHSSSCKRLLFFIFIFIILLKLRKARKGGRVRYARHGKNKTKKKREKVPRRDLLNDGARLFRTRRGRDG